jgi:hypothetical protein
MSRALWLPALVATTMTLAGCGQAGGPYSPTAAELPLVDGARIVAQARQCDPGASAYCAVEFVVVDNRYRNATDLLADEQRYLAERGWAAGNGDFGNENGADSPGHKLRLTYGTAQYDLEGVDQGWIQRSPKIALALSQQIFDRAAAMSLMLEMGSD